MSLFSEVRRRNVLRVAAAYVVIGWLITEVVTTLLPVFGAPEWVAKVIVAVIALGFIPAVIFSWAYELTPDGLRKESDVPRDESITSHTARKLDYITIASIVAAIIFVAWSRQNVVSVPAQEPIVSVDVASVAVLPFINLSGNEENEYFSDGLTETLLHMLAQVPELKVAARTSSFVFKGKAQDIRQIADALDVTHVLEGSVQRAAGRVRITAQLIRADDGFHVWSENYDRTLQDIFAIQDEIAEHVSGQLTQSLLGVGGNKRIASVGTDDVDAYDLYLRAISEQAKFSFGSLQTSEALLKEALAFDPDFLDAKTQLATNISQQVQTGMRQRDGAIEEMAALLEQVLESRPDDVRAKAWYLVVRVSRAADRGEHVDWDESIDQMRALAKESPSEVDPKRLLIEILAFTKDKEEIIQLMQELRVLDPLNPAIHLDIGRTYYRMGDWDNARASFERSLELQPGQPMALDALAAVAVSSGDAVQSVKYRLEASKIDPQDPELPGENAIFMYALGLPDEGDSFRARVMAVAPTSPVAAQLEIYRSIRLGSREEQNAIARRMIADNVEIRAGIWQYFALFRNAAIDGTTDDAMSFVESINPGFQDFAQVAPIEVNVARLEALGALSRGESAERLQQRLAQLDYFLNESLIDGGGPITRMQIQALKGDTDGAIEIALNEIFSKPAIANSNIDLRLGQLFVAEVAADPRIQSALSRWQAEKSEAAQQVAAYLAGLD